MIVYISIYIFVDVLIMHVYMIYSFEIIYVIVYYFVLSKIVLQVVFVTEKDIKFFIEIVRENS